MKNSNLLYVIPLLLLYATLTAGLEKQPDVSNPAEQIETYSDIEDYDNDIDPIKP